MNKFLLAFLLPIFAYFWVIVGFSVGEDCVMTAKTPRLSNYLYCQQQVDTGAYVWQLIPEWKEVSASYLSGRIPWWSSHSGLGAPLAANFISGAFNIPTILSNIDRTLLFARWWMVFRLSLGSLGTYWLLSILGFSGWTGLAGASLFVFNGYVTQLFSINHHEIDMYLPWIIGSLLMARKQNRFWIVSGILLGLSMLVGMPESTIFVWSAALVFTLYLLFQNQRSSIVDRILGPATMVLLAIMIGSILILPGLEFIHLGSSTRTVVGHNFLVYSVDPRNMLLWLLPKVFGPAHNLLSKDSSLNIVGLNYWGISSFILIAVSFIKKRSIWSVALIGMMAIYFGVIKISWALIPVWKDVIYIKYSLGLINLLAAIEVSRGISEWSNTSFTERKRLVIIVWGIIISLLTLYSKDWLSVIKLENGIKHLATILFLICQLGFGLMISRIVFRAKSVTVLSLTVIIELLIFLPWLGARNLGYIVEKPEFVEWLTDHVEVQDRIFGINGQIYPNWSSLYGLNDARYIGPLWPKNYVRYLKEFIQEDIDDAAMRFASTKDVSTQDEAQIHNNVFFDLLGVKYLISNSVQTDLNWKLVFDETEKIYENTNALPRVRFIKQTICANDDEDIVLKMKKNKGLLREVAIKSGSNCHEYPIGEVLTVRENQNELHVDYSLQQEGYVLIADNWYPGWKAQVNDIELTIDRVNLTMRGVELPAGKHSLVMTYQPSFLRSLLKSQ